jgi:lichenan operon transcriptional antiterminator
MLRTQLQSLFDLMDENEYRPAGYFADRLKVSLKTVRNHMKELSDALKSNGADIESKPRYGYRIVVHDRKKFTEFLKADESALPKTSSERNLYLLKFLLMNNDYVKIDDLCSLLFISRSSISASIRVIEKTFNQYGITLERKPNYGIKAVGDEFDIRRLLCYSQMKHKVLGDIDFEEDYMDDDLMWIGKTVLDLLSKFEIHLTEVAFDNFVNYVYVGLQRVLAHKLLTFNTTSFPVSGIKEKAFTEALCRAFEEKYGVEYDDNEREYILLYLSGKQLAGYNLKSDDNFVISEEINHLCLEILQFIDKEYHTDFQSNFDLRLSLNQHLVPLEVRMKYGLPLTNPLAEQTKKEYPLAFNMAYHAKTVLCNHYKKDLSEDEIGYLALIFALQLKKDKEYKPKKANVLIVSNANTSAMNLLKYKYENRLSNLIEKIYVCDLIGLNSFDFERVDYIFTTVPITIQVPKPIFEIDLFSGENETKNIEEALWREENSGLRSCYTPKRFVTKLKGKDKNTVLKELCTLIRRQEEVDSNFYDLVMQRDQGLQVAYGNKITIPHPDKIASKYTFAYVAVLDEPIQWDEEQVQVILLSSPGSDDVEKRQNFYESAAKLVLSPDMVNALIEKPTFENFIQIMEI